VRPRLAQDPRQVLLVQAPELLDLARLERVGAHDGHPAQVLLDLGGQVRQLLLDGDGLGVRAGVVAPSHRDEQWVRRERGHGEPGIHAEHDDEGPRVDDRRVDEGQKAESDEHRDALKIVGRARHEVARPPGLVEAGLELEECVEEVRADLGLDLLPRSEQERRDAVRTRAWTSASAATRRVPIATVSRTEPERPVPPRASTTSLVTHGIRRAQAFVASRSTTPAAYRARCRARYRPRLHTDIDGSIPAGPRSGNATGPCDTLRTVSASPFLAVALDAARGAGRLLREEIGGTRRIQHKRSVIDLVTEMDQRSEAFIVERLLGAFPDHAVLAEESGATAGRSEYRWLIDPLDGTTNYAHGVPIFAVSVALERAGVVELGVGYDPSRDECFVAERGRGATMNGEAIKVSVAESLDQALLVTGFPYDIRTTAVTNLPEYAELSVRAQAVRRLGSAVIDLCWVACGRLEGFWEFSLGPWDMAAGGLIVAEAGGRVTNVEGGPWRVEGPGILATNGRVHDGILAGLRDARVTRR
jgi:myo-inositol-1(or 4)-monophosphatase